MAESAEPARIAIAGADAPRTRRPWWIPPFLGAVPDVGEDRIRLLGLVSLALFFEQYDFSMLAAALPRIADGLGMSEAQFGPYLSLIRLGALPAFLILPLADRLGRRRLFLGCVVAISVGTFATALVRTPEQFVAVQMITRSFMIAGMSVAFVFVTEEFPADHRGWGIGMLGALGGVGIGLGAALFAAVDVLPYGWRALYAVGLLPLLLLPRFRRGIRETRRFETMNAARAAAGDEHGALAAGLRPIVDLVRDHPRRVLVLAGASFLSTFGVVSVFQFTSLFTVDVRGWAPWQYSLMFVGAGAFGIVGNVVAGRLGDRIGRRAVGAVGFCMLPLFGAVFYHGPDWSVTFAWMGLTFGVSATTTIVRALGTEIFPTSQRGTAMGMNAVVETLAAATGLAVLGLFTQEPGQLARAITLLCTSTVGSALLLLLLPETRARELEELAEAKG